MSTFVISLKHRIQQHVTDCITSKVKSYLFKPNTKYYSCTLDLVLSGKLYSNTKERYLKNYHTNFQPIYCSSPLLKEICIVWIHFIGQHWLFQKFPCTLWSFFATEPILLHIRSSYKKSKYGPRLILAKRKANIVGEQPLQSSHCYSKVLSGIDAFYLLCLIEF